MSEIRGALVTGGIRGIGAAIARRLARDGMRVACFYRSDDSSASSFASEAGVEVFRCDVSDVSSCAESIGSLPFEIDVLVNNAGITDDSMFHRMSYEQWRRVLATNLDSMFSVTRPVIAGMRSRGWGRIVNVASINGQKGQMGQVNYSASKAGVIGFTKSLALESARKGITVNCVCPGYVETDMTSAVPDGILSSIASAIPVGRLGFPDEIASAVSWLCSDEASFANGSVVSVNGGHYMANG